MSERLRQLSAEEKRELLLEVLKKKAAAPATAPLSFHQRRLWFIDQFQPGNFLYNMGEAVLIKGALRIDIAQRAFDEIVRRHESLRTTFHADDGEPVQVVSPPFSLPMQIIDLSELDNITQGSQLRSIVREENRRPFDLTAGPLIRVTLLRLSEDEHVGFFCVHHIVADGWSMGVLVYELATLYRAFFAGQASPLPALPVQYKDYARWQRDRLQGETLDQLVAYWKKALDGAPYGIQVPTDKPRTAALSFEYGRTTLCLTPAASNGLKELSTREGATLYMTLLAALTALLYRVTGQEDIILGSPVADRERPEVQGLIGFLVNTLVMRADLSGNPTFRELLKRVRHSAVQAYAHQDLPFDKLVEVLRPRRNVGMDSLLQIMFALQNMPMPPVTIPGLTFTSLDLNLWIPPLDLAVEIFDKPEGLSVTFAYQPELFEKATIDRFARWYVQILSSLTSHILSPISEIPILTESERRMMVVDWNRTHAEIPSGECVHHLLERQVRSSPDAVAMTWPGGQCTYGELNSRANKLANYLYTNGVGPEVVVGICLARSPEMIVAMLGILKAGGAYLPLDPSYPRERLASMLKDSGTRLVVTSEDQLHTLENEDVQALCIDSEWPVIAGMPEVDVHAVTSSKNLAYIIYTSGSTGEPKGVMIEHRSVVNLIYSYLKSYVPTPEDKVLQLTSMSFDASVGEIFPVLCAGGVLVLPEMGHRLDADALVAAIRKDNVTILGAVPSVLAALNRRAGEIPTLRLVLSGGEALTYDDIDMLLTRATVVNAYGPTETTVCSLFHLVSATTVSEAGSLVRGKHIPIGRPIINTQVFVLDRWMQPVPVGVPGELYIGGSGVARGYLGRPDQTAERFVPHPFSSEADQRLYKTGDLVRYRADGSIEFLSRSDQQVKLRGLRIELGEIESALNSHPSVSMSAAAIRDFALGEKQLVVFYVPASGKEAKARELRQFLHARLPAYMVPVRYVPLESLPLTPSGKVDYKSLPAVSDERPDSAEEFVAPRNERETVLARIWCDVLHLERAGVYDDFFALGGHSLLAVQMMSRVKDALGVEVPVRYLFESPSVAQLAERIERLQTGEHEHTESPLIEVSPLVPLRIGEGQIPVFCIHYIGGHIHPYRHLAAAAGTGCRIYGIQSRALTDPAKEHKTLTSMAGDYAQVISNQMSGAPCHLVGYSSGGLIALAVAGALEKMDRPVGSVHLLDTYLPGDLLHDVDADSLQHLILSVQEFFRTEFDMVGIDVESMSDQASTMFRELLPLSDEERLERICLWLEKFNMPREEIKEVLQRQLLLYRHHYSLVSNHLYANVAIPLFVWWAEEPIPGLSAQARVDWSQYTTGKVVTETIQENHFSMMRPPAVGRIARRLAECVRNDAPSVHATTVR